MGRRGFLRGLLAVVVLAAGLAVSSCGGGGSAGETSWTYMVYMAADNSLSSSALTDVDEMEKVGSTDRVKVAVEAEFNPSTTMGVPDGTIRGMVTRDSVSNRLGSWYSGIGDQDMTDPDTLREFIAWAAQAFPADHYALVIWSHGMGWKGGSTAFKGVITDNFAGSMSIPDLAAAIRGSGVTFDVINFDTCLMGMYEVAYELKGLASYLAFSEEEYPAYGDPYDRILADLNLAPAMGAQELAGTMASDCAEFYTDAQLTFTRSVADMGEIEGLHEDLATLAGYFIDHMGDLKPVIEEARDEAYAYDYPTNIDLADFLRKLRVLTADAYLQGLIDGMLGDGGSLSRVVDVNYVYMRSGDASHAGITNSGGIAIYLPSSVTGNGQISTVDLARYSQLACNQSPGGSTWSDFLNSFLW